MQRYYIPALGNLWASLESYALAILRVGLGLILMAHGCQKLFGMFGGMGLNGNAALFTRLGYHPGMFWGTLVGCTEFFGGILLVIGLFTRFAAAGVVIFMINAIYVTSKAGGFFWTNRGSEFSILIFFAALFFLIRGAGSYSVDEKLGKEL